MKLGLISDSHGHTHDMEKALDVIGKVDMLLHAGDFYADAEYLQLLTEIPVVPVVGNCDAAWMPAEEIIDCNGTLVLLTHGHQFGVKSGLDKLGNRAQKLGAVAVVFGHTHIEMVSRWGRILMVNPGSVSLPRGSSGGTCGLLTLTDGRLKAEILPLPR